jgi:hypothetical protein
VAAFVIVPVEVSFAAPASFELPASGLTPDTAMEICWANAKTGVLELHGEGTVTATGTLVDVNGQGLSALGWFLFYEK